MVGELNSDITTRLSDTKTLRLFPGVITSPVEKLLYTLDRPTFLLRSRSDHGWEVRLWSTLVRLVNIPVLPLTPRRYSSRSSLGTLLYTDYPRVRHATPGKETVLLEEGGRSHVVSSVTPSYRPKESSVVPTRGPYPSSTRLRGDWDLKPEGRPTPGSGSGTPP